MDLYYGTSGTNSSFRNQEDRRNENFQVWVIVL